MAKLLSCLVSTQIILQCITLIIKLTSSTLLSVPRNDFVDEPSQRKYLRDQTPYAREHLIQPRPSQNVNPFQGQPLRVQGESKEESQSEGNAQGKGQVSHIQKIRDDECKFCTDYIQTHTLEHATDARKCKCHGASRSCDCQSCNLTSIPADLPWNITMLNLFNNSITSDGLCYLSVYTKLKRLTLDKNLISRLNPCFFRGLQNLQYLNLRNNTLLMLDENFPPGTFASLTSLKYLKINKNNPHPEQKDLNYPDIALSDLTTLETLEMDGLRDKPLKGGFRKMHNLRYLSLAGYYTGYCNLGKITNKTFENVPSLTFLNISDCLLIGTYLKTDSFAPLQNLSTLDLYYNELLGMDDLVRIMSGLRNSNLQHFNMGAIVSRFSTTQHLNKTHLKDFPRSLRTLRAVENCIETVTGDFFEALPPNITELDVTSNKFVFGWYLMNLSKMANLETLILNGGNYLYAIPKRYPVRVANFQDLSVLKSGSRGPSLYEENENDKKFVLELPPKLKTVTMNDASLQYRLTYLEVNETNSLERLEMDRNYFPELIGPFIGLIHLKYLSISSSFVGKIHSQFFSNLTTLTTLQLHLNLLGDFFAKHQNVTVFQSLSNLRVLDLSTNSITKLGHNVFAGLSNLRQLHLDSNRFREFDVDISHMTKLQLLNLSKIEISTLTIDVANHIDFLVNETQDIRVDLSFNPIACTCQNLNFLKWMVQSKAFDPEFKYYKCMYSDASVRYIDDAYKETICRLSRECVSHKLLLLIVIGSTIIVFIIIVCAIVYRFRWKLRYLYYMAHSSYKGNRDATNAADFDYDIFVSYAFEDEQFVVQTLEPELKKRELKTLIHGRDFAIGDFIASNIVEAVKRSKKTLVVLTEKLLASKWCNFELQMANQESVTTGRQVLVFLIKETIPATKIGSEFLCHIRNNTYIEYPNETEENQDERLMKRFWDRMAKDLK